MKHRLSMVHPSLRDDAVQEAWLAHCEGRSIDQAINSLCKRETRHRRRSPQLSDNSASDDGDMRSCVHPAKSRRAIGMVRDTDAR